MRLAIALLIAAPAWGAVSWTVGNTNTNTNFAVAQTRSITLAVTAGQLIIADCATAATQACSVSDDVNGAYDLVKSVTGDRTFPARIYAKVATTTATVTITTSTAPTSVEHHLHVAAFTCTGGTPITTPNVTASSANGTAIGSITTTVDNTLLLIFADRSTSIAPASGYTSFGSTVSSIRVLSAYKLDANSAGSHTPDTTGGTQHFAMSAAMEATPTASAAVKHRVTQ